MRTIDSTRLLIATALAAGSLWAADDPCAGSRNLKLINGKINPTIQMAPGDKVTVVINPLRDGSKGGLFVAVTLADGKIMGDPTRAGGGPINVPQTNPPPDAPAAH